MFEFMQRNCILYSILNPYSAIWQIVPELKIVRRIVVDDDFHFILGKK